MTDHGYICKGCGVSIPQAVKGRRLWCSDRCRKNTSYGGTCVDCGGPTSYSGRGRESECCRSCDRVRTQGLEYKERKGAITRGRYAWSDDDLAAVLRVVAVDGRVTTAMFRVAYEEARLAGLRFPSLMTYHNRWGSWNAAVEACGLTHGVSHLKYSRMSLGDLASHVVVVIDALGHLPSVAEYVAYREARPGAGLACCALIRRRFGNWPAALAAALDLSAVAA